jgi:hypothetical protein
MCDALYEELGSVMASCKTLARRNRGSINNNSQSNSKYEFDVLFLLFAKMDATYSEVIQVFSCCFSTVIQFFSCC